MRIGIEGRLELEELVERLHRQRLDLVLYLNLVTERDIITDIARGTLNRIELEIERISEELYNERL